MMKSEKKERTLNAKLFVRILPSTDFDYDSIKIESNKKVLYVRCLQDLSKGVNLKNPNYWCFCTDGVFWNSCQSEVFETVTSGLFEELFDGVRAIILCYGQTGAGKTFTTSGLRFPFQNRGLILRILSRLFEEEEARRDRTRISLAMSYVEFTGQHMKDLIGNKVLAGIRDVVEYPIPSEVWAWRQVFASESRKSLSEAAPYKGSNRGHSVLTLYTHAESLVDTDPVVTHSKIHIVDMAGIDYLGSKASEWRDKWDLGNSNLSKSLLEQLFLCMTGAAWRNKDHVCPYKSSRFLSYLHDTLNSKCLLRFIAHIYGTTENLPLTISSLKFGERIGTLRPTKLERVYQSSCELQVRNLEREFLRLKDEAEMMGMLRDSPDYANVSQERFQEIKRAAEAFLFGQLEDLTLFNLGEASLTLEVFRNLYQRLSAEKDQIIKDAIATATEMVQNQLALERNSTSNVNIIPVTQKVSRRKSRQVESQVSFGVSFRSSDSVHNIGRTSSVMQQAGVTDRKGISIGPGKTGSTFEGNVTKAFKKLKSKKSDSVIVKGVKSAATKELGVLSSKNQALDEISELSVGQTIPSREVAWQHFFNERTELAIELRANVGSTEETAQEAKRKYTETLGELARVRDKLDESRLELETCQHIRHVCGRRDLDDDDRLFPGDAERAAMEVVAQNEGLLGEAIEKCHVALIDLRNAAEELAAARRALEEAFQDFCKENYKTAFASDDQNSLEIKSEGSGKGAPCEQEPRGRAGMELFLHLQESLLSEHLQKPNLLSAPAVGLHLHHRPPPLQPCGCRTGSTPGGHPTGSSANYRQVVATFTSKRSGHHRRLHLIWAQREGFPLPSPLPKWPPSAIHFLFECRFHPEDART